jgi:hypothetical protein
MGLCQRIGGLLHSDLAKGWSAGCEAERGRDGRECGVTHWVLHVDLDQFIAAVELLRAVSSEACSQTSPVWQPGVVPTGGGPGLRRAPCTAVA